MQCLCNDAIKRYNKDLKVIGFILPNCNMIHNLYLGRRHYRHPATPLLDYTKAILLYQ